MRRRTALPVVAAALVAAASSASAPRLSLGVVISEVYGGAGCGQPNCSIYGNDFVELYNRGSSPVDLAGWSIQYASAGGVAWQVTPLTAVTLLPGQHYLVAESGNENGTRTIPPPDASGSVNLSATAGKVALLNRSEQIPTNVACPPTQIGVSIVVDFVGYGFSATCYEGSGPAIAPNVSTSDQRRTGGNLETDDNAADFELLSPTPEGRLVPTAAVVAGLAAVREGGRVVVSWRTLDETGLAGFRVLAGDRGGLAGRGGRLVRAAGGPGGHRYRVSVAAATAYWVETIALDGRRRRVGPVPARLGREPRK